MPRSSCLICGAPTKGSRCRTHTLRNGSTRAWRSKRSQVLLRDGHRCQYRVNGEPCGEWADTVDHIVSLAQEGTEDEGNLRACCRAHNWGKGSR